MMVRNRRLIQTICLAVACFLLWPLPFWAGASKFVIQLSPFVSVCSAIATRSVGIGLAGGLIVAAIAIFQRRWFCIYACPVGLLLDGLTRVGLKKSRWWSRCPSLGKYFAILTMTGSIVGYPLLLWMDPLAIFSNSFAIRISANFISGALALLGLLTLFLLSFISGSVWCARWCPLGGTLDLLASIRTPLRIGSKTAFKRAPSAAFAGSPTLEGRRYFIFAAVGLAAGFGARRLGAARRENAPLRPPGAVAESTFTGMCLRCGHCVRSCPTKIVHPDVGQAGIAGLMAPVLRFDKSYCREDCAACTKVCPSGALQPLELAVKNRYIIGEALMDGSLCVLALGQRDCDACMRACPFQAVQIHWDEEQYVAYPVVDFNKCNGCGACEVACPTAGDKAIRVWKRTDG
ncbi:MAG TPA: 4Fe-4S dicluster domain-containing protein [Acidobacteriota bacterium]|nr:4Fe-4S dicluster domain-containing protein [Acidobacteriota bacterium]